MKVLISPLVATSTLSQSALIKKLIEEKGYDVEITRYIGLPQAGKPDVKALLWFSLGVVEFIGDAQATYILSDKPRACYVTVEGVPALSSQLNCALPAMKFITVSNFAKGCMEEANLKVIDVVHHAIDLNEVKEALANAEKDREMFRSRFGDVPLFLYVGRHDPRKGLPILSAAIDLLQGKGITDFLVLLHTDKSASSLFMKPNAQFLSECGSLPHVKVLSLMALVDFLVFPTMCEGFGLPLLEANSVGTPVLHAWFPPLDEFSSKDFNFTWDFEEKELINNANRQWWIFHKYSPEALADMMEYAIDIWKNHKDEYQNFRAQAMEHSKAWDYHKIYPQLLKYLEIS
jgi:glycosyltransferase involved in cell wall biosynthesis